MVMRNDQPCRQRRCQETCDLQASVTKMPCGFRFAFTEYNLLRTLREWSVNFLQLVDWDFDPLAIVGYQSVDFAFDVGGLGVNSGGDAL